jgi:hypothetical protein
MSTAPAFLAGGALLSLDVLLTFAEEGSVQMHLLLLLLRGAL